MKKILLSSVATLATLSAFSALAADLPSRKAPVIAPPPPPMWTGFYAGLNAGYNFGTNANSMSQNSAGDWRTIPQPDSPNLLIPGIAALSMNANARNAQSGFAAGGQVGYLYQYGSNIVLGLEADIQGSNTRGTSNGGGASSGTGAVFTSGALQLIPTSVAVGRTVVNGGVDWLGTVRGRIGYL